MILRRLLLDRRPVLHMARKRLQLPAPSFAYTPTAEPRVPRSGELVLMISLGSVYSEAPSTVSDLTGFLAASTGYSYPDAITVATALRYFSHAYGGVHLGHPESRFEEFVQKVAASMPLMSGGYTSTLVGMARVVIPAIEPIAEAIAANPYPSSIYDMEIETARQRLGDPYPLSAADRHRVMESDESEASDG